MRSVLDKLLIIILICFCTTKNLIKQDACTVKCRNKALGKAYKICGLLSRDCCISSTGINYGGCYTDFGGERCRGGTFSFKC